MQPVETVPGLAEACQKEVSGSYRVVLSNGMRIDFSDAALYPGKPDFVALAVSRIDSKEVALPRALAVRIRAIAAMADLSAEQEQEQEQETPGDPEPTFDDSDEIPF